MICFFGNKLIWNEYFKTDWLNFDLFVYSLSNTVYWEFTYELALLEDSSIYILKYWLF